MSSRTSIAFEYLGGFRGALFVAAVAAATGCGGESANSAGPAKPGEVTHRDIRIVHQDCPIASAEKINVGGDAKPDLFIVTSGGREVCRGLDLNFDGVIDSYVYRDGSGNVVRRENDYDRDGRIDEISIYRGGVIVEKDRATTLTGRLDTWQFYQGGKLARTERDSDGDAQIDQWWEYPKPDQPDCPLIHSDVDGDGHPDPGATVDVCGESSGYTPPERPSDKAPSGASFEKTDPNALPTELENKAMPGGAAAPSGSAAPPAGSTPPPAGGATAPSGQGDKK